jgi:hypothetical protein
MGGNMRSRLIPPGEWFHFFDQFSRRYQGWRATVRVLHPSFGSQVEARDMPLEGIVAAADGTGPISVHLGGSTASNIEHEISAPRQVWVELSETGAEEAVGVVSEDGTKTILELRAAAPASRP